jgi:hypothetical protein
MSDKQPVRTGRQLSALDPVFCERRHEYLDRLRAEDPVHRDAEVGRLFLTRFEDVKAVLSNRSLSVDPRKAPQDSYYRRNMVGNVAHSRDSQRAARCFDRSPLVRCDRPNMRSRCPSS